MMRAEHLIEEDDERRGLEEEEDEEAQVLGRSFFSSSSFCLLTLPLGLSASTFCMEKAVCSHGLFMMAPNLWDPSTKTLQRPLRLSDGTTSLPVRISHPPNFASLHVIVFGADSLSLDDRRAVLAQVERMLRLLDKEERNVREFHKIHKAAKEEGFGRVFRSPTLFEDMVKCILLCNCQWPRTLTMARALCELQFELKCGSFRCLDAQADSSDSRAEVDHFLPKMPKEMESNKKRGARKVYTSWASKFARSETELETNLKLSTNYDQSRQHLQSEGKLKATIASSLKECNSSQLLITKDEVCPILDINFPGDAAFDSIYKIGNFPSPKEIAGLDEDFLAKRCNLGYRASRILKLAQNIMAGTLELRELEEVCNGASPSCYDKVVEQLKEMKGFGPFTCANVLMCMGFYEIIPTDTETIRHLKQVHATKSTSKTVQIDVEKIYGKYAPFQFLAYWSELWHFYEERFGKLSEMPHSDYQLITAGNMRTKLINKWTRTL
ncbi:uncharacterized protein LOC122648509 isoform X2 [Telopea speciosissima]|uniref:uncharacterized protein LOC122648509 isoform X2 n=1 Tax=Telopea speciosissima TaxID=54955 RepID=UPI001CC3896F|nr:uncharacterized protein LOC122648509 isoform X2 [Telopea speciosissima]